MEEPDYQAMAVRCGLCHVGPGHLMEMKGMLDGTVHVDYCVFPADGYETIGQEVMMSAIPACEGIRGKGVPVIGHRPVALDRQTGLRPSADDADGIREE